MKRMYIDAFDISTEKQETVQKKKKPIITCYDIIVMQFLTA